MITLYEYNERLDVEEIRRCVQDAEPAVGSWPLLDGAALHGPAGEFVRIVEPHSEVDPVALVVQFLVAFGNAAGRIVCRAPDGTGHYMNLDTVLCGASSRSRKGSSWYFVNQLFELADKEWATTRVQSGLSSGEGVIWAVRDPITKLEPVREHGRVVDYQTVEADPGVMDKRLLLLETEFASVLKVLMRDGNTLSAILRQAWDTGNIRTLTKNSPIKATAAHISIIAHITIEELLRFFNCTEAANGFGNRFLFCCVRRSKVLSRGGRIDEAALGSLACCVAQRLMSLHKTSTVEFSEAAYQAWDRLYPALSAARPGLLGSMLARSEAQVSRLAFVYAALDGSEQVEVDHLRAATALWEYCEKSVEFIFGNKLGDAAADRILSALRDKPEGLTRTEISDLFGRNLGADRIDRGLQTLRHADLVEVEPKSSHTAERWRTKDTKTTNSTNTRHSQD